MVDTHTIRLIANVEVRAASRNWWILLYAAVLVVLLVGVSQLSAGELAQIERGRFGRTAAGLTNVALLIIPLLGLTVGALAVAPDRERGLVAYYLAQPVTAAELFWGKYLGGLIALTLTLLIGFTATSLGLARSGALEVGGFVALVGLSLLLATACYSVGVLISTFSRRSALALAVAIFAWVALLFLGDLGLMATAIATRIDLRVIVWVAVINPAEAFKVASIDEIGASLDSLGPAGVYLTDRLGAGLLPAMTGVLALWIAVPTTVALARFRRQDAI